MGFLSALHERRGVRLPAGVQTVSELIGHGGPTTAGITVTEDTAEGIPTVFACVRVISTAVGMLPIKLYRRGANGATTEAVDRELYRVLHSLANHEMSSFDLRVQMTAHLALWGCAFAEIQRDARGDVSGLWPLLPWKMAIDRDDRRRLRYRYSTADGQTREWLHDPHRPPILRLIVNSLDGITGRSIVTVLRESLGLSAQLQRFGAKFFKDGIHAAGVLEAEEDLDVDQRREIQETIEQFHGGTDRAHRVLVLEAGRKYEPIGMPLEDAQFLESRKFQRSELAGCFGVPPHLVGDLERSTFANVENESLRWLTTGADAWLTNWEASIARDCLGRRDIDTYFARFTRAAAVRGNLLSRSQALEIQRRMGIIDADEWRRHEELSPIGGAAGSEYVIIGGGTATPPSEPER